MTAELQHVLGVVSLAWAVVALTVVLLMQPKATVMKRRLVRRWKEKNESEKSHLVFTGGLVAAFTAWILVTVVTGSEMVAVVGIMLGSLLFVVLGALFIADRYSKKRRPR